MLGDKPLQINTPLPEYRVGDKTDVPNRFLEDPDGPAESAAQGESTRLAPIDAPRVRHRSPSAGPHFAPKRRRKRNI